MRKKPKGRKYRNLYKRGNVIYYEREWKKNRTKQSTDTSDWWSSPAEWLTYLNSPFRWRMPSSAGEVVAMKITPYLHLFTAGNKHQQSTLRRLLSCVV